MSPQYSAELPWNTDQETIELLRGIGSIRYIFEAEFDSRRAAIRELANEYEWLGLDADFWNSAISGKRGRARIND